MQPSRMFTLLTLCTDFLQRPSDKSILSSPRNFFNPQSTPKWSAGVLFSSPKVLCNGTYTLLTLFPVSLNRELLITVLLISSPQALKIIVRWRNTKQNFLFMQENRWPWRAWSEGNQHYYFFFAIFYLISIVPNIIISSVQIIQWGSYWNSIRPNEEIKT